MQVKALPTRLRCDSLSAHTDQTRFLEGEAGDRAQSDIRCGMTLALMGSSYGENRTLKSNLSLSGAQSEIKPRLYWKIPAVHLFSNGKSLGNPVVEVVPPNGTNNLTEGTNKNELRV
jgi:hypothetical protein